MSSINNDARVRVQFMVSEKKSEQQFLIYRTSSESFIGRASAMNGNGGGKLLMSTVDVPKTPVDPANASTTTLSTIAIKAGEHATIVVALLKSMGYVELRIDEMRPGLLALGGNYEETANLLQIHDDLMHRLREKEDQVEVLLTRADNLVHEKEDPNEQIVYEAMAQSLGTAWRELNRQLHLRGYLLQDTLKFYEIAVQHEKISSFISQHLQSIRNGGQGAQIPTQIQTAINDLYDITAHAMSLGAEVMAQTSVLGNINDNAKRAQETLDACKLIEREMLRMATVLDRITSVTQGAEEAAKLSMQREQQAAANQLQEIEDWLIRCEKRIRAANEFGLQTIQGEISQQQQRLVTLRHLDEQRVSKLEQHAEQLMNLINQKLQKNVRIQQFFQSAHSMSSQLDMMEQDLRNANAAMAGELAPLARQKASAVISEGRSLLSSERLSYEEQRQINIRVQELENKLQRLEQIAADRSNEAVNRVTTEVNEMYNWLTRSAEPFMQDEGNMGQTHDDARRFVQVHKNFAQDVVNRDSSFENTMQKAQMLDEQGRRTLHEFEQRYESLKRQLEVRIQLGNTYEQVHGFARDLDSSFDSLSALLSANKDFTNEKVASQMNNVFHMIQETLGQERHQGEKFINSAQTAAHTEDSALKVDNAVESVRRVLVEHENRFSNITQNWEMWQKEKVETKKFVNVVEEVQVWQEEVIEIIGLLENTHITTSKESEGLQKRILEIKNTAAQQEDRLREVKSVVHDEQLHRRVDSAQQKQAYINDKLAQLERKVNTVHETLIEEEVHEVVRAPEILSTIKDSTVNEGQRFEFAARIEAEPEPSINWLKDGVDVKQNVDYHTEFVNGVATLTIEETFIEDSAIYTVRASNKGGTVESSAKLDVISRSQMDQTVAEDKPRFVKQLQNVTINEGETATLDCVIVGKPEPEVVWYKEETTAKEDSRTHLTFRGDHCSLSIDNAEAQDTGLYTVRAKNTLGEAANFCHLKVSAPYKAPPPVAPKPTSRPSSRISKPPAIQPTLTNNTYREGDAVKMQVFITGEPRPQVQWTFNEQPIVSTKTVRIEEEESGWSRLIIDRVGTEHAGMYTVFAVNEAGEARTGATLHVVPQQPQQPTEEVHTVKTTTEIFAEQSHTQAAVPQQKQQVVNTNVTRVMNEGYWTDGNFTGSPTPPPIPKHRYQTEEFSETEQSEVGFSRIATEPEFIRPFHNEHTVNEGEKLTMECMLVASPRPKVHWYFNDKNITLSQGFVEMSNVGDTYKIHIPNARLEHAGYYKMVAENCRGKTETLTVVHVRPRSMQRRTEEEFKQKDVSIVHRTPSPAQRPRSRTGEHTTVTEEFAMYEVEQRRPVKTHEGSRLVTPPPAKRQLTQQHHRRTEEREAFELEEQRRTGHPPHFTHTLVSAVAAQGEDARFEGIVTGWPAPDIEWTKDGVVISRATNPEIAFSNIGGRVSLTFNSCDLDHAGKYMCTARNSSGVATSSAQLVVRPQTIAPDFIQRLISEEVVEGEELRWTVKVTGDPAPKVTWLRDGEVIPHCDEVQLIDEGNGVHTLLIVQVEAADCGQFTCLAENVAGEARSTADLVIRSPGADPGSYFHVTKVTQEKQVKGEAVDKNTAFTVENPPHTPSTFI